MNILTSIRKNLKQFRRSITYSKPFIQFLANLASLTIEIYSYTLKVRLYQHPEYEKGDPNKFFYGFWHGRQFILLNFFRGLKCTLMTELSWAGEIQTRILERFGYKVVRGSSKRKGARALLNMKKAILDGYSGAIALDGPTGPIYKSKPGILFLSGKMEYPVVPVITSADRVWILRKSWCKYLLPRPFSRCLIVIGKPISTAGRNCGISSEELDSIMIAWMKFADLKVGRITEEIRVE
jgi:lysophospholipid acyltransferase (LPLAT)-like uncharacterized protein